MLNFKSRTKKLVAGIGASFAIASLIILPAKSAAEGSGTDYLALIAKFTGAAAESAKTIEQHTLAMLVILNSWILPDETDTTASLQTSFAEEAGIFKKNNEDKITLQPQLNRDFYGDEVTAGTVPYANDMTYSALIGQPFFNPDPRAKEQKDLNSPYNYLKNVASLNITHVVPNMNWKGSLENKLRYKQFYTTVSAIQTHNAYILSELYLDKAGKNSLSLTQQQNQLIAQASSSDWFTKVATESMGVVLRQLLMYNSQIYVLMTQQLQTQKQMLATLAMTNSLIVIGDQFTETQLLNKATGTSQ